MTQTVQIESPLAGLHASEPEPLPFAPALHIRAFLLRREAGNLLVYAGSGLERGTALDDLGGVSRRYLNHWHEAMFLSDAVRAPLFCHEDDRGPVEDRAHVRATFSRRHSLDGDFEVVPTPGHTPGATAYLWNSGDHRLLFTGDTLYLREGDWVAAVLEGSSDREVYMESLELIRELDFDVLVPWVATGGQPYHAMSDPVDARRRIDAVIRRLRRGEDH